MANFFSDPTLMLGMSAGLLSGRTGPEQAGNMFQAVADYSGTARTKNRTLELLAKESPELAQAVQAGIVSPSDAFSMHYKQRLSAQTPDRQWVELGDGTYGWADKRTGSFDKLGTAAKAGANETEYGLTPVYGTDPRTGKTVIGQISKSGTFKPLDMPENFVPSTGTGTVDLGNEIGTIDRRTGQIVSRTPKNLIGAESDRAQGKAQGEARGALPQARGMADEISRQISDLKADPYLDHMLGSFDSRLPNVTSDAARVQSKMDQLDGGAFLQARQMLKGGGAITDFESGRAEKAYARLNKAQTPEDYKAALDDFEYFVKIGLQKLEQTANVQPTQGNRTSGGVSWSREN